MFSCHGHLPHRQLSSSHALGTQTLSTIRAVALLDLQLLSPSAKLHDSAFPRMLRIFTGTRAPVLRTVRVRLRRDARTRALAGQRTGSRLLSTDAAVAEAVRSTHPRSASSGFILASTVLRLQRVGRTQICGKAALHSSQPSRTRIGGAARRLEMEQLPSLPHRRRRSRRDRIPMDSTAPRKTGNHTNSSRSQRPRPSEA
jgi:hypothetical protein